MCRMNSLMSESESSLHQALATTLLGNLAAFQSFARQRLGDEQLAADAVQESLLRALKSAPTLSHDENLLGWLYRILRNVITDLHRRRAAEAKGLVRVAQEVAIVGEPDVALEQTACACFRGLLPGMRPEYAQALQLADLGGEPPALVAKRLGITRNNFKVRLHRARKQLRERLEQTCNLCAKHGCLDCTCSFNS